MIFLLALAISLVVVGALLVLGAARRGIPRLGTLPRVRAMLIRPATSTNGGSGAWPEPVLLRVQCWPPYCGSGRRASLLDLFGIARAIVPAIRPTGSSPIECDSTRHAIGRGRPLRWRMPKMPLPGCGSYRNGSSPKASAQATRRREQGITGTF